MVPSNRWKIEQQQARPRRCSRRSRRAPCAGWSGEPQRERVEGEHHDDEEDRQRLDYATAFCAASSLFAHDQDHPGIRWSVRLDLVGDPEPVGERVDQRPEIEGNVAVRRRHVPDLLAPEHRPELLVHLAVRVLQSACAASVPRTAFAARGARFSDCAGQHRRRRLQLVRQLLLQLRPRRPAGTARRPAWPRRQCGRCRSRAAALSVLVQPSVFNSWRFVQTVTELISRRSVATATRLQTRILRLTLTQTILLAAKVSAPHSPGDVASEEVELPRAADRVPPLGRAELAVDALHV